MTITQAYPEHFADVKRITQTTIHAVYPRYYPAGAVAFFSHHHSDDKIRGDIESGNVYLLSDDEGFVGTVTINDNSINRLFVLPQCQHKGYGRALLDFAERAILEHYDTVVMDASLPAKRIYLQRGYREIEYHTVLTDTGDYLCYDVMELNKAER